MRRWTEAQVVPFSLPAAATLAQALKPLIHLEYIVVVLYRRVFLIILWLYIIILKFQQSQNL